MGEEKIYCPFRNNRGLYVICIVLVVLYALVALTLWLMGEFPPEIIVFSVLSILCCIHLHYLRSIKIVINGEGMRVSHGFSKKEAWISFAEFSHARYVRSLKGHTYLLLSVNPIPQNCTRIFSRTCFALERGNIQPTEEGCYCVYMQYAPEEITEVFEGVFFEKR